MSTTDVANDLYRIGTVAKLTGIAVERLRAWERRYGLEPVHRAGKTRFYSVGQVTRLQQMKRLLDQGQTISSLVNLSTEQLEERYAKTRPKPSAAGPSKIGLIGPNLLVLEQRQEPQPHSRLEVSARWGNLAAYLDDDSATQDPLDLLFIQTPVLLADDLLELQAQLPDTQVVAVYQFSTKGNLAEAADNDLETLHWPLQWTDLEHVAAAASGSPLRAARTAPRRYSDADLIAIAASNDDPTGCPAHLVELITQLNAFADFSLSIAEETGSDIAYERVHTDTTQARAQLELALELLTGQDETTE